LTNQDLNLIMFAAKSVPIPDAPFPVLASALVRSQTQDKPPCASCESMVDNLEALSNSLILFHLGVLTDSFFLD